MTSLRTFLTGQFIQNARSFCLTFQTLFYLVRLAIRVGLLYVRYQRGVPMRTFRSFTPTCTPSKSLYLGLLWYSKVLHVPRVDRLNYPSHHRLSFVSRNEMASLFCWKAMVWGETLNFSTTEFAKGPRILNMVMTFVLTPRSHYNTITKPCARFLLSFTEDISRDFPSHMIESMIYCYRDIATRDKLIFSSAITCIL